MSHKTHFWLLIYLLALVFSIALLLRAWKQLSAVLFSLGLGLALLALLGLAYVILRLWLDLRQRVLDARGREQQLLIEQEKHRIEMEHEASRLAMEYRERERKAELAYRQFELQQHLAITRVQPTEHGYAAILDGSVSFTQIPYSGKPALLPGPTTERKNVTEEQGRETEESSPLALPLPPVLDFAEVLRTWRPSLEEIFLFSTVHGPIYEAMEQTCHIGLAGATGGGKCLEEHEPVFLADGQIVPAKSLIGATVDILGVTDLGSMRQVPVAATFANNGIRRIIEIELDNGVVLKRTEEHPLWAARLDHNQHIGRSTRQGKSARRTRAINAGWVAAKDVQVCGKRPHFEGHVILCPTTLHQRGTIQHSDDDVILCAVLLAEGGLTRVGTTRFTSASPEVVAAMTRIAESYQCEVVPIPVRGRSAVIDYRICNRERRPGKRNPVNERVREWGMDRCSALQKHLPEWIFQLPPAQVALFLRTFIDCDGWFDTGRKHMPSVNVSLANNVLVQQIGQLALRLGITGTYRYKPNGKAGAWTWSSPHVDVWQQRIGSTIKADALARAVSERQAKQAHAKTDWDAWRTARPIKEQTFADCPPGYEWRKVVALRSSIASTVAIEVQNDNHAFVGQAVEHNTNCLRLILAQFLACGADLYLANPNFAPIKLNGRSIEDWRPIVGAMRHTVAWKVEDIQKLITGANRRLDERRERQQVSPLRGRDVYLALGEWPAIQSRWKDAAKPVAQLLREARQYGIHVVSEFQDALVSTLGMSSGVRESFRNAYYFGGDANTARVLLDLQGKGPLDETGLGSLGASLFRANSQPAVRGRVPFLSNQALYMLLGTPNNPLPDRLPQGADPKEFFADHGIPVEAIDGEPDAERRSQTPAQTTNPTVYCMPGTTLPGNVTGAGSGTGSNQGSRPVPGWRERAETSTGEVPVFGERNAQQERITGTLGTGIDALAIKSEQGSGSAPEPRSEYRRFTPAQEADFVRRYRETGSIKESITQMHLSYGRYQRHASEIVQARRLRKEA